MKYLIKEDVAKKIKFMYKWQYFMDELGISKSYLSLVMTRTKAIPKKSAFAFTKVINKDADILDYFEIV